jgi:hypothetical protein
MLKLINLSNHNSNNWNKEQRGEFGLIVDIPFPNINPDATTEEVEVLVNEYVGIINANRIDNIMLQGEFTFCYLLQNKLRTRCKFWIPTTERKVVEKLNVDDSTTKTAVFEFKQWRVI